MLEVCGISVGYGDLLALRDVSLGIGQGEFVGVVGANAAGKTTLARAIAGLLPLRGGDILWDGRSLRDVPAHRRPELGIMMVPEGRALFPFMTVRENLEIGATNARARAAVDDNIERVFNLFSVLRERADTPACALSGGQQQMLAIGRALMGEPRLLILDEPSVGLAPLVVREIYAMLLQVFHRETSILLIEQDVRQCLKAASHAYVIANGRVVLSGAAADILASDDIRRAYLGL